MIQQQWLQLKMKFAWDNSDKSRLFLGRPVHTSNSQRCHHGWCQPWLIFDIITCIIKSMIATSTYFLLKFNWKKKTRKMLYWSPKRPLYMSLGDYMKTVILWGWTFGVCVGGGGSTEKIFSGWSGQALSGDFQHACGKMHT